MVRRLRAFGAFCYDLVIGDDWRMAVGLAVALGVTYAVSRSAIPSWWVLPAALLLLLPLSVWRAGRRRT